MAKLQLKAGTTSKDINIFAQDSSVATGAGLTGLVFNSGSLTAYYHRQGAASATAITLATKTVGTWATGGFVAVDGTNLPGLYELGIPDAALAAGAAWVIIMLKGASNLAPVVLEIELTATDNQAATNGGLTNLDAAITSRLAPTVAARTLDVSAGGEAGVDWANVGSPTTTLSLTGTTVATVTTTGTATAVTTVNGLAANVITATSINADAITAAKIADGAIDAATFAAGAINAAAIATDAITAAKIAADAIGASELAADAVTEIQSGLATSASIVTLQADTDDIQTRLPAALVSGRMDSSVGAMAANVLTATAIATDAITAAKIAADAIGASELAADAVTEIQSGLSTLNAAGIRTAVGLATANLDTQLDALPTNAELATALGTADDATLAAIAALNNISTAQVNTEVDTALADVGLTSTITGRIDAAISTRLATASYTVPPTAAANADAIWDETLSGHLTTGSTGEALNAAGASGDPWTTALPGAYGAGSAGKIIGDNINATVSSRATQVSVDDIPTNAELATSQAAADDATLAAIAGISVPTVSDILAGVVEGSITLKGALRLAISVLTGKASGGGTTTIVFRDTADTKDRITTTVDSNGNRTTVTRDITD